MQQLKEKTTSALILEAFGINSNRQFLLPNNANTDKVFLSDHMLWALCQLLQQKLQQDQRLDVEIVLPFLWQKTDKKSFSEHLAEFRETLVTKVLEKKQQTQTILIPFKTVEGQWQLMILTLQDDLQSYRAEVITSCNLFSSHPQSTSADIVTAHYLSFAAKVQEILGRISGVTYSQSTLQSTDQSSGSCMFMNMLDKLKILSPSILYSQQLSMQQNSSTGECQGFLLTPEADLDWRVQLSGLLFLKTLYQENPQWKLLTELLPNIQCGSTAFSRTPDTQPNLLFVIAEKAEEKADYYQFVMRLLDDTEVNYYQTCEFFGNNIFLWAMSRLETPCAIPPSPVGFLYKRNISDLYQSIHGCPVFMNLLFDKITATPELHPLLTQPNVKGNFFNTPLLMATKNYNISLALELLPYYDLDSLLMKTWAQNTVLHLAAYYRIHPLINGILNRAKALGSDALDTLLAQKNGHGKVPAQCYMAETLAPHEVRVLCESAMKISIGACLLKNEHRPHVIFDLDKKLENIPYWIMDQEFVTLGSCQEGAHRYTDYARAAIDHRYIHLLRAEHVDVSYTHLKEIFTPKVEPVINNSAPVFRVYFRNTCSLKDQKTRQFLVDALFAHFSDSVASIYVEDCSWSASSRGKEHQVYELMLIKVSNDRDPQHEMYLYKILTDIPSFERRSGLFLKQWGEQEKLAYEKPYEMLKPNSEEKIIQDESKGMQNK